MAIQYRCQDERRLQTVLTQVGISGQFLNGIDYLEVSENRQTLTVHLLQSLSGPALSPDNLKINRRDLSRREIDQFVEVISVSAAGSRLTVRVEPPRDLSPYTLFIVQSPTELMPPVGFDPQLSRIDFSFFTAELSEFDCRSPAPSPDQAPPLPPIDYLAKDFASFRQLMLDRMAVTMPEWVERSPADIGNMLVELFAYVADHLSYYQDAVATEAYLGTARQRISVRRHARLLDYFMHDGCNARAWIWFRVDAPVRLQSSRVDAGQPSICLVTQTSANQTVLDERAFAAALNQKAPMFEILQEALLHPACNEMRFYTWGDGQCELVKGATRATLEKSAGLRRDYLVDAALVFEEIRGAQSGLAADANPDHRHVVRLTRVRETRDPLFGTEVFEIEWHLEDALPFTLYVGTVRVDDRSEPVSVARGNLALADHGRTVTDEVLPPIVNGRPYRPQLQSGPLTQQGRVRDRQNQWLAFDPQASASAAMLWKMRDVQPVISLRETVSDLRWTPQIDLLNSDRFAREFVVEAEGTRTYLRFGDGQLGKLPPADTEFQATYRVGNGLLGNVGAGAIAHIYAKDATLQSAIEVITEIRNPLPATGGRDPEPIEQVQLYAPYAFREQQRAVTEADYAEVAQRFPGVQRAVATRRWTGSWYTIFITVDRVGGRALDSQFKQDLMSFLKGLRLAGHDLAIDAPRFVPLDIALTVKVHPDYFRGAVKSALLTAFSNKVLDNNQLGFFHPDNFTFGQSLYMSPLIARAMTVPGVESVQVDRFQRWRQPASSGLEAGELPMSRLEIVQVDNDPTLPENGRLQLTMEGGL
ncbi:MAG: putative baseplate assembly protein [Leptolyngbya sp. SIO4C1]|nr:putative baseplate assembly protein [Leptolyngbya sp. SIO4C1]